MPTERFSMASWHIHVTDLVLVFFAWTPYAISLYITSIQQWANKMICFNLISNESNLVETYIEIIPFYTDRDCMGKKKSSLFRTVVLNETSPKSIAEI